MKNRNHLVPVKKTVIRDGQPYVTTIYVNPNQVDKVNKKETIKLDTSMFSRIRTEKDLNMFINIFRTMEDPYMKELYRNEFVDFLKESGVKWEEHEDKAINWMRALMKVKRDIKNGQFIAKGQAGKRRTTKFKPLGKTEARSITKTLNTKYSKEEIHELAKKYGIEWKQSEHEGINHMRCMMAIREAIEDGNGFEPLNDQLEANKDYLPRHDELLSTQGKAKRYNPKSYVTDEVINALKEKDALERPRFQDYPEGIYDEQYQADKQAYRSKKKELDKIFYDSVDNYLEDVGEPKYTKDDVKKWAKKYNVKVDKTFLEEVDMRLFNDLIPTLDEMFTRFPILAKPYLDMKDKEEKNYRFELYLIEGLDEGLMEANKGIGFNKSFFKDYREAVEIAHSHMATGFTTYGDGTICSLFRHELGHSFETECHMLSVFNEEVAGDGTVISRDTPKISQFDRDWFEVGDKMERSEYSHVNDVEFFAEAFSEITSSKNPKPWAVEWQKGLRKWGIDI